MKDYEPKLFRDFGFTIVDEVHHISAEVFSRALPVIGSYWNLGLSATPHRSDGLSKVFYWHLGPLLYPKKEDISISPNTRDGEIST
jgi:DNA or RNA helicases of superfamily II